MMVGETNVNKAFFAGYWHQIQCIMLTVVTVGMQCNADSLLTASYLNHTKHVK